MILYICLHRRHFDILFEGGFPTPFLSVIVQREFHLIYNPYQPRLKQYFASKNSDIEMRRSVTILFLLLLGTLFVKQVRAPLPHLDEPTPDEEPAPVPNTSEDDGSGSGAGSSDGDDSEGGIGEILDGGTSSGEPSSDGIPAAPVAAPAEGNEAIFEEEDNDYSEVLDAVSDLLDAITSIISDLGDGSSTTVSAPLPTAALPCYSVSSIYNECGLHNSEFPYVVFPIQASCLCYVTKGNDTTATWAPSSYDGYLSDCNNYAQTQTQASITNIGNSSSAFNLCASAGDVRATPALAAASSTITSTATPASSTAAPSIPIATGTSSSASRMSVLRPLIVCIGLWFCRMVI